jgi:predicted RNase H-like HicB family nuclease
MKMPLPVILTKEGKWFVAACPVLDIATQGKTEKEVKENMEDLINEYLKDPDTPKPKIEALMSVSLINLPVNIPKGVLDTKTTTVRAK